VDSIIEETLTLQLFGRLFNQLPSQWVLLWKEA